MFNGGKRRIVFAGAAVLGAAIIAFVLLGRHGPPAGERGTRSTGSGPTSARNDFPTNSGGGVCWGPPIQC